MDLNLFLGLARNIVIIMSVVSSKSYCGYLFNRLYWCGSTTKEEDSSIGLIAWLFETS